MPETLPYAVVSIATALLLAVGGSLFIECLVKPRSRCLLRRTTGYGIHFGLTTIAFALLITITQRPYFAAALTVTATLVIVIVSNAKYRTLREPFVFTDFGLFSQALRHPRLYLPFLGLVPALTGLSTALAALVAGIALEPSLLKNIGGAGFAVLALVLSLIALALLTMATRHASRVTLDPIKDIASYGLLSSLWLYWLAERRQPVYHKPTTKHPQVETRRGHGQPHIVAVQSESFFDVRRLWPDVRPGILRHFDRICEQAMVHGQLVVPAWGANTMRTEFAFLSGIEAGDLGVHRFNPYRRLARRPITTIASRLQRMGYRTICLHPHPASFFGRDQVMPQLGFSEFLDIGAFGEAPHEGPYISDAAVTGKIRELLREASEPTFIFAITMENHGPLHLEQVASTDVEQLFVQPPPDNFDDLTIYLRHLKNADGMIAELTDTLANNHPSSLLCFFGDHVPSMPDVYDATGFVDGRTDYFIWSADAQAGATLHTNAETLGELLLKGLTERG